MLKEIVSLLSLLMAFNVFAQDSANKNIKPIQATLLAEITALDGETFIKLSYFYTVLRAGENISIGSHFLSTMSHFL